MNLLLPRDIVEAVLNDKKTKMHEWLSVMEVNFSRTAKHECRLSRRENHPQARDSGFYNKRTKVSREPMALGIYGTSIVSR